MAFPEVSVVLPCHNEQGNVERMHAAIRQLWANSSTEVEIIFVDDGSSDESAELIMKIAEHDPLIRLVRFSRNFGHQAALIAGLTEARGNAIITMDCDFQHPPELLPQMVQAWAGGAKVVQMVRTETADASLGKRLTSRGFYRLIHLLSDVPVVPGAADFQLLDRDVVDYLLQFRDRRPFLRGNIAWLGFPSQRISYAAPPREWGRSSYGVARMLRLALDAIISLSSRPLQISFYIGLSVIGLCLIYAAFILYHLEKGDEVAGWASTVLIVMFLGAVQLLSVGILGEYIARIYDLCRGLPPFVSYGGNSEPDISVGGARPPVTTDRGQRAVARPSGYSL
jgi:dolichol-phosphate mannosyltransferase